MNIIVVGIGKVGYAVADRLAQENHDVTIIDTNEDVINETLQDLDVIGIIGNGASSKVLSSASVEESDMVIALTGSDEVNILCCLMAKRLGTKNTIARVRNPEYNDDLRIIKDSLGLSVAVNPEREAAAEFLRTMEIPLARNVELFGNGKVDMLSFKVNSSCTLIDKPIKDSFSKIKSPALCCAVERGDDAFIPDGNFIIRENDTIAVLTPTKSAFEFFKKIGYKTNHIHNIMIIGGGKIAIYLAKLLDNINVSTTIVEKDLQTALKLSSELPNINVVHGDGTNRSLLLEEGIKEADAFCCLTGIDEENIVLSLFAKSVNPKAKTLAKVNHTLFKEVIKSLDIDSVIYPKITTANIILKYVRSNISGNHGDDIKTITRSVNNNIEIVEFTVSEDSKLLGKTLLELDIRKDILLGTITRGNQVIIPSGSDSLQAGDDVVVVTTTQRLIKLDDILE